MPWGRGVIGRTVAMADRHNDGFDDDLDFAVLGDCPLPPLSEAECLSLLTALVAFLKGGMALRQRHALVIASLRTAMTAVQRGCWTGAACTQLVPIMVGNPCGLPGDF